MASRHQLPQFCNCGECMAKIVIIKEIKGDPCFSELLHTFTSVLVCMMPGLTKLLIYWLLANYKLNPNQNLLSSEYKHTVCPTEL